MTKHLFILVLAVAPSIAVARQAPVDLTSGVRATRASISAVYERYTEDDSSLSQVGFPLALDVPLGRQWSAGLRVSRVETSGDGLETLSGITDAQLEIRYARRIGAGSLVLGLGANLPTGQVELTDEEFRTVVVQSQSAYALNALSLGQGKGLSPSATWAVPAGDRVALGLGAAYQYRGGFRPVESVADDYSPGDELLLTAGLDARTGRSGSVSLDLTYTRYGADRLGKEDVYQAGDKMTAALLVRGFRGLNEWRVLGLYRSRARSDDLAGVRPVTGDDRVLPNELTLQGTYSVRWGGSMRGTLLARLRSYNETPVYPARTLLDFGVMPAVDLSRAVAATGRLLYTAGTFSGVEAGVGFALDL